MIIHVFLPFFDVFIAFLSYMTVGEENIAVGVHLMLSVPVSRTSLYTHVRYLRNSTAHVRVLFISRTLIKFLHALRT